MDEYRLTRQAERDVAGIYRYSSDTFGIPQADRYTTGLTSRLSELAVNPVFGRDYGHIIPGVRRAEYGSHSIYFRNDRNGILVLRILHQRMDPARWL